MERRVFPSDVRSPSSIGRGRKEGYYAGYRGNSSYQSYGLDIQKAAAWANVVFLGVLVIVVLVLLLVYTASEHTVTKVEDSVITLSHTTARALNMTQTVTRALDGVNMTRVIQRAMPPDEDAWLNATNNAKRSLDSMSRLITKADDTDAIGRYSDLAHTVTMVLSSPKVSGAIEKYSDTAIWAMDLMKTPEAQTAVGVAKESLVRMADTMQSKETHDMIDRFLNGEPTERLMLTASDFVTEAKRTLGLFNDIVEQVKEQETVRHMTDMVKVVKRDNVVGKMVDAYDKFGDMEQKFESIAARSLEFVAGLLANDDK